MISLVGMASRASKKPHNLRNDLKKHSRNTKINGKEIGEQMGKEVLEFESFKVHVDSENLKFDEQSLSNYIQLEGGYYDNFGAFLALAERFMQNREARYEKLYNERFIEAKDNGGSDKLAEAKAKADSDVADLKQEIISARYIVNRLKNHLKAWDKNHDNAQSMGHTLRKQLDRLHGENIYGDHGYQGSTYDKDIANTVGSFEQPDAVSSSGFEETLTPENMQW